jgi:hypothetical protein
MGVSWLVRVVAGVTLSIVLAPTVAVAQITGIAGVVRDTSGAVVPGVTVEASSPALIEKVRSVTTDAQGLYQIVDLRPGVYTVTFSLQGFQTVRREGVELTGSFTATVNAELSVGALEETITVSGAAPTVDVHNVVQQRVLSDEVREDLPTARNVHNMAQILPGTVMNSGTGRPSSQDVGGLSGDRGVVMIHGSRPQDYIISLDGSMLNYGTATSQAQAFNPAEGQEYIYETAALSAESQSGGLRANVIPKEGGNRFSGFFLGSYAGSDFQNNNLDDELRGNGLNSVNELRYIYDTNASVGGPLKKDRLWFFGSFRRWGEEETVAGAFRPIDPLSFVYNPQLGAAGNVDLSRPNLYKHWNTHFSGRLTWQANPKNKFSFYMNTQPREQLGMGISGTRVFEASIDQVLPKTPNYMLQASWKSPVTPRLLLEAVYGDINNHIVFKPTVPGIDQLISATDLGTGFTFRSAPGQYAYEECWCYRMPNVRASASYVTGAHVAKFGTYFEWGKNDVRGSYAGQSMNYTLRNAVPTSVTIFNQPRYEIEKYRIFGLFAQDQWTIRRFTANAGVRLDTHVGWIPSDQASGPGPFVAAQTWPAIDDLPNWKDVSPRLGLAYDLFGNGKTALKATASRYVVLAQAAFAQANNPLLFNVSASRGWNDQLFGAADARSNNYVPDCDLLAPSANGECGALSNPAFGTAQGTSRPDDAIREGWGVRQNNWEVSGGVHHELVSRVSVDFSYFRRWYGNFTVTDNLALTPADYTEYCITAPADSRLPEGGGNRICGLYDVNRIVSPNNLVTFADNYGEQTETYNGIDATVTARLPRRISLSGGLSSGTSNNVDSINSRSNCFVVDSPGQLRFCDIDMPWRTGVRFLGTFGLPWDMDAGLTFLNNPGPQITAAYTVVSSQVQFVDSPRTALTLGSATIPLIEPGTEFGERMTQVDVRVGKTFRYRAMRIRALLDVANLFNSNAVLVLNTTYGGNWQRPTYVLPGRLIKPTVQIDF